MRTFQEFFMAKENLDHVSPEEVAAVRTELDHLTPRGGEVQNTAPLKGQLLDLSQRYAWLNSFTSPSITLSGISVPSGSPINQLIQFLDQHPQIQRFSAESEALRSLYRHLMDDVNKLNYSKASPQAQQAAKKAVSDFYGNM